ncbi:MAG: vitamin B12 dependent-methionine synthase activation domain-containing protein [Mangrovibacterium sp.]
MTIHEISFSPDELAVNRQEMKAVLGFSESCPEPFNRYLEEVWEYTGKLGDIRAVYRVVDQPEMNAGGGKLLAGGLEFEVGNTILKELRYSEQLVFFICTAGERISSRASKLLEGDNLPLGYLYDVAGSYLVEAAADRMQQLLGEGFCTSELHMTNRYSPGYCHWPVSGQQALFSLFGSQTCGVRLTSSSLMLPVKSVSGLIGIGRQVRYRDYPCELCSMKSCSYRSFKQKKNRRIQ